MLSLHPSQLQLLRHHLLLRHLCLLARQLGIVFDPEAHQQGELRPKPGQPGKAFLALPFHWRKCSAPATPPRRPLQIHPSPTDENRRRILTVDRKAGSQPTFSQLDGEGDLPPDCPTCQRQIDSIAPENRIEGSKNCSPPHNPATCTDIKPCNNCDECFHRICCKD